MMNETQICTQCETDQPKKSYTKYRQDICKTCYNRANYQKFKERYGSQYYRDNAKKQLQRLKQDEELYEKKKETQREVSKEYYQKHKVAILLG
jgi:hypothetical protein